MNKDAPKLSSARKKLEALKKGKKLGKGASLNSSRQTSRPVSPEKNPSEINVDFMTNEYNGLLLGDNTQPAEFSPIDPLLLDDKNAKQFESLQNQISQLSLELEIKNEHIQALESKSEFTNIIEDAKELEQVDFLKEKLAEISSQIELERSQFHSETEKLYSDISSFKALVEYNELESKREKEKLERKVESLEHELEEKSSYIQQLQNEIQSLNNDLATIVDPMNDSLVEQSSQLKIELNSLKQENLDLKGQIDNFEARLASIVGSRAESPTRLSEVNDSFVLDNVAAQLRIETENAELKQKAEKLSVENKDLTVKIESAEVKNNELHSQIKQLTMQRDDLGQKMMHLAKEFTTLKQSSASHAESWNKEKQEFIESLNELNIKYSQVENDNQIKIQDSIILSSQIIELEQDKKMLQEKIQSLEAILNDQQSLLNEKALSNLDQSNTEQVHLMDSLRVQNSNLSRELELKTEEVMELSDKILHMQLNAGSMSTAPVLPTVTFVPSQNSQSATQNQWDLEFDMLSETSALVTEPAPLAQPIPIYPSEPQVVEQLEGNLDKLRHDYENACSQIDELTVQLDSSRAILLQMREHVAQLEHEKSTLNSTIDILNRELESNKATVDDLTSRMDFTQTTLVDLSNRLEASEKSNQELTSIISKFESDLNANEQEFSSQNIEFRSREQQLTNQIVQLESELRSREQEIAQLSFDLQQAHSQLSNIQAPQSDTLELESYKSNYEQLIKDYESLSMLRETDVYELSREISELQQQLVFERNSSACFKDSVSMLENELESVDNKHKSVLQAKNHEFEEIQASLEDQIQQLSSEILDLKSQIDVCNTEIGRLEAEGAVLIEERNVFSIDVEREKGHVASLTAELDQTRHLLQEARKQAVPSDDLRVSDLENQLMTTQSHLSQYVTAYQEADALISRMSQDYDQLMAQYSHLAQQVEELTIQKAELEGRLSETETQFDQLKESNLAQEKVQDLESELLNVHKTHAEELTSLNESFDQQRNDLASELLELNEKLSNALVENENLTLKLDQSGDFESRFTSLSAEKDSLQQYITDLESALQAKDLEIQQLYDQYQQNMTWYEDQFAQLTAQSNAEKTQLESQVSELSLFKDQAQDSNTTIDRLKAEIKALKQEIDHLNDCVKQSDDTVQEYLQEIHRLKQESSEYETFKMQLDRKEQELQVLASELDKQTLFSEKINEELIIKTRDLQQFENELANINQQFDSEINEKEQKISSLQAENEELKGQLEELEALKAQIESLGQENSQWHQQYSSLESEYNNLWNSKEQELAVYQQYYEQLQQQSSELLASIEEKDKLLNQYQQNEQETKSLIHNLNSEKTSLSDELSNLSEKMNSLSLEKAQLEAQKSLQTDLESQISSLKRQLESVNNAKNLFEARVNDLLNEIALISNQSVQQKETFEQQMSHLSANNEELKSQIDNLSANIANLESFNQQMTTEIEAFASERDGILQENEQLKQNFANTIEYNQSFTSQLEAQLQESKSKLQELEQISAHCETLKQELSAKNTEIEQLKQKLNESTQELTKVNQVKTSREKLSEKLVDELVVERDELRKKLDAATGVSVEKYYQIQKQLEREKQLVASLTGDLESLRIEYDEAIDLQRSRNESALHRRDLNPGLRNQVNELNAALEQLVLENERLVDDVKDYKTTISYLQHHLNQAPDCKKIPIREYAALVTSQNHLQLCKQQFQNAQSLVKEHFNEIEALKQALSIGSNDEIKKLWSHALQANNVLRQMVQEAQNSNQMLLNDSAAKECKFREHLETLLNTLEQTNSEIEHLKAVIHERDCIIGDWSVKCSGLESRLLHSERLLQQTSDKQRQTESKLGQISILEASNRDLAKKVKAIETELQQQTSKLESEKQKLFEKMQKQTKSHEKEIEEVQEKYERKEKLLQQQRKELERRLEEEAEKREFERRLEVTLEKRLLKRIN